MKTSSIIQYKLSPETFKFIEQKTRCSQKELVNLSFAEQNELMKQRGSLKESNKIQRWFADTYKKLGEKLGLLKKEYNFYTHVD